MYANETANVECIFDGDGGFVSTVPVVTLDESIRGVKYLKNESVLPVPGAVNVNDEKEQKSNESQVMLISGTNALLLLNPFHILFQIHKTRLD